MEELKNKAPESCDRNKGINKDNISFVTIKSNPFDVPNTIRGCYGEYEGVGECIACDLRLGCARMTQGGDNE